MKTRDGWKKFFRSHPIFQNLTLVSLEKLFYLVELKFYIRNQPIFKEGDEVKGFYVVYEGEVSLSKMVKKKIHQKLNVGKYFKNSPSVADSKFW